MQVVARLMDRVLAARNARVTVVGATSGDTGGAAIEAFRGSKRVDAIMLFPNGRVSDVQRRMMTTATEAQRACRCHRRHVRRLPGALEGHVQRPGVPRPRQAGRRQLHQLGPRGCADHLLLRRRSGARQPASRRLLLGTDRQLRRHLCGLLRQAHGAAGRAAGDCHQRQRHPPPHACHRHLRGPRRHGHDLAVDGHPGLVQLRALSVRGQQPRRRLGARQDGRARPVRPLRSVGAGAREPAPRF